MNTANKVILANVAIFWLIMFATWSGTTNQASMGTLGLFMFGVQIWNIVYLYKNR